MVSTFGVPELALSPTDVPDFERDFDEMVRDYIYTEYALTDPDKTAANTIKFKVGFFDYKLSYEIAILQRETDPPQYSNAARIAFTHTTMEIHMRMKRLSRSETEISPQLGRMEREIERIAMQYRTGDIAGIKAMIWAGSERIYNAGDSFAQSDWRSMVRVRLQYQKVDIS